MSRRPRVSYYEESGSEAEWEDECDFTPPQASTSRLKKKRRQNGGDEASGGLDDQDTDTKPVDGASTLVGDLDPMPVAIPEEGAPSTAGAKLDESGKETAAEATDEATSVVKKEEDAVEEGSATRSESPDATGSNNGTATTPSESLSRSPAEDVYDSQGSDRIEPDPRYVQAPPKRSRAPSRKVVESDGDSDWDADADSSDVEDNDDGSESEYEEPASKAKAKKSTKKAAPDKAATEKKVASKKSAPKKTALSKATAQKRTGTVAKPAVSEPVKKKTAAAAVANSTATSKPGVAKGDPPKRPASTQATPRKTLGVRRTLGVTGQSPGATRPSTAVRTPLAKVGGNMPRIRAGLSKHARVPRLHSYLARENA